jgi:TatA/E family protein of Tat protein translocase
MFGGIGTFEILVILFVALLLFGSKRIPEIAQGLGKGIAEFRKAIRNTQQEIEQEISKVPNAESPNTIKMPEQITPSPKQ